MSPPASHEGGFGCLLWAQKSLRERAAGERLERFNQNHIPSTLPGFDEGVGHDYGECVTGLADILPGR